MEECLALVRSQTQAPSVCHTTVDTFFKSVAGGSDTILDLLGKPEVQDTVVRALEILSEQSSIESLHLLSAFGPDALVNALDSDAKPLRSLVLQAARRALGASSDVTVLESVMAPNLLSAVLDVSLLSPNTEESESSSAFFVERMSSPCRPVCTV